MKERPNYRFHGDQRTPAKREKGAPETPEPYVAEPRLIRAVNLAMHLERPLLLEGEAGCGKTRLARAVAFELGLPFKPWYVNSRTRVEDGLYSFDAIGRLHDVQIVSRRGAAGAQAGSRRNPDNPAEYLKYGPLGEAFRLMRHQAVVLIDEIDKANIDFPNDLLTALDDDYKFMIPETGEEIRARRKPIVIITSNREKGDLPEPFLRRCIYFFLKFPNLDDLKKIVHEHYKVRNENPPSGPLIDAATQRFLKARETARSKRPGTSEFLDWMKALCTFEARPFDARGLSEDRHPPYPEALFKVKEDWEAHQP